MRLFSKNIYYIFNIIKYIIYYLMKLFFSYVFPRKNIQKAKKACGFQKFFVPLHRKSNE